MSANPDFCWGEAVRAEFGGLIGSGSFVSDSFESGSWESKRSRSSACKLCSEMYMECACISVCSMLLLNILCFKVGVD